VLGGVRPGVVTLPVADGKPVPLPAGLVVDPAPVLSDPVTLPLPAPLGVPSVPPDPALPLIAIVPPAPVLPLGPIVPPEVEAPPEGPPAPPPPVEPPPEPPADWAYATPAVAAKTPMVRIVRFMEFTPASVVD
jgi:periplasmic protein TonB